MTFWVAAVGLAATSALAAPKDVPVFSSEARVVAIPVFVTDKDGRAVSGLTAAEFAVEDEGKPSPIVAFEAIDTGSAASSEPVPSTVLTPYGRRQFLLLIDLSFSDPSGLHRTRAAALRLLDKELGPRDRMAIAVLGPRGPTLLVGFTNDVAVLRGVLANPRLFVGETLLDPAALAAEIGPTSVSGPRRGPSDDDMTFDLSTYQRETSRSYGRSVARHLQALLGICQLLRAVPGHKQVVLFSKGFDESVLFGAAGDAMGSGLLFPDTDLSWGDAPVRRLLQRVAKDFGEADAVLHTVDVGGLTPPIDLASQTPMLVGRGRDSLATLAAGSGGFFLREINDVAGAVDRLLEASRYFYVLGVPPADANPSGRFRSLTVKVRSRGLHLSFRRGYVAGESTKAIPVGIDAFARGVSAGAFALAALAVPTRNAPTGPATLSVVLHIDGQSLLSGHEGATLPLEIHGDALDETGAILDTVTASPSIDLGKLRRIVSEGGLELLTVFDLSRAATAVRFLVRHLTSGRAATLRIEVPVERRRWPISPPLVMSDPSSHLVMPMPSRARPEVDLPFRVGSRAFSPMVEPVLTRGTLNEVCVMTRPPRGPSLEVTADLGGADGTTRPLEPSGPVRVVPDRDGAYRIVLGLIPNGIPAGRYTLRVALRDDTDEHVASEAAVTVR